MKKAITVITLCICTVYAYSQDNMNKKMENKTDPMNKHMENKTDPMNKHMGKKADEVAPEITNDSLMKKTSPARKSRPTSKPVPKVKKVA